VPVIKNRANVFLKTTDFDIKTIITKNKYTQTKNTAEHRVLIDYLVLNEIVKSLPFGVGTGDYQDILNIQYERINFKVAKINQLNTHNQYLCEFMKTGVLGGLVFILIIFNLWKKSQNHIGFYFVLMFSLGCLVESYLDRQHGVVIFAFIIPFILKIDNKFFKLN